MPAYDRFWDLAVTTGIDYDFADEIVQSCMYQREIKRKNNVKGRALMTLPKLKKWEKAAAQCLNKMVDSEVILNISLADMLNAMNGDLGKHLKRRSIFFTGVSAALSKRVREFTIVDPLPNNFGGLVISKVGDAFSIANAPVSANGQVMVIDPSGAISVDRLTQGTVGFGYLHTAADMADIALAKKDTLTTSAVAWILGGGASKIRITCHGDGEGKLEMLEKNEKAETLKNMSADCLATWLHANGLTEKKNLQVINMNLCMAAKYKLTPAVIKNGKYSPAEGSAVELVARTLGQFGVHRVTVTGSNEVISGIEESAVDPNNDDRLTPVGQGKLLPGQNVRRIQIPGGDGFTFTVSTLTLTLPPGWTIAPYQNSGSRLSRLYRLKPPTGWTVERIAPQIKRADDYSGADFIFHSPGGKLCTITSQGWMVDGGEVITAEGWTFVGPGTLKFNGTGGTIAIEGKPGPGQVVRIFERIAKGAKAAAVS